jgi:NADPH:quinone reductase-like Zn-dependent oxidoreductase
MIPKSKIFGSAIAGMIEAVGSGVRKFAMGEEEGSITPVIDRRYPLPDAAEAMKYALEGHVQGKVVVEVTA